MNAADQFHQAMTAAGLEAPGVILDDGALRRFGKGKACWYVLHGDGIPAGAFGDWRAGLTCTWCAKSEIAMTAAELAAHRQRVKAMRAQRDADEAARQQDEAAKAAARWQAAGPAAGHPYLARKGVAAHGIRQDGDTLLVPLRDAAGILHSLQTITPEGDKRFKGRMKGCFHAIGQPKGRIVVCEGYATGASIHEATGEAVAVAFNAGNVGLVAAALHRKYPGLVILLAADDDWRTEGNPGLSAARQAALAVGGFAVAPQFPPGRAPTATDFNDLAALAGLGAVRACFDEIVGFIC